MARSYRKLFPAETTTNQTLNCYGFCDPSCPSNCYTNPNYYYFSPPPQHLTQVNHISSYLIILISLFTVIFIVVGFYVIKMKCYAEICGPRVHGTGSRSTLSQTDDDDQGDHIVWLITTVGLQQSIINSITVCKYSKNEGLVEGTECSVCLNDFREGEMLRLMPKCSHAFHISCIDTWLRSHTNCPLCRAGIVSNNVVSEESGMSNFAQENSNLGRNEENVIENNMVTNVVVENRAGTTGETSETNQTRVVDHIWECDGDYSNKCKTMRRSSIEEWLHIKPVPMKRSFSWNGRILSTRGYMNLNSAFAY